MANPEKLSQPRKQRSVERGGVGQSGYTAGRQEGDAALDASVDTRRVPPPGSGSDGLGTDDRFTGRGGPAGDREGRDEAVAEPYPDPAPSEPDGASGRADADRADRADRRDDALDREDRTDRAGADDGRG